MKSIPMHVLTLVLFLTLTALACESGNNSNDTTAQPDASTADEGGNYVPDIADQGETTELSYPPAPYGLEVGSIIVDLTFEDPGATSIVSLSDLYLHPDKKVLLLTSGAGWCSACKQEATELIETYSEYGPQGLEIWSTLFQDYAGEPADTVFWQKWTAQYNPNYPVLIDSEFALGIFFDPDSAPMNMLIRLDTMEIVLLETGYNPAAVEAEIKNILE